VAATRSLALLENMRLKINVEVEETKAEVQRVCSAAGESEQSLAELKSAISSVSADLEQFRSDLESTGFAGSSLDERARLEYQSLLRGKIAKADLTLHELQDSIPSETEKHKRACDAVLQIESRLKDRQNELLSTQERIQEVRSMLSRYVGNAASAALGSSAF